MLGRRVNIGTQFMACHLRRTVFRVDGRPLDGQHPLGGKRPHPRYPLVHSLRGHPNEIGQFGLAAHRIACSLNRVHGREVKAMLNLSQALPKWQAWGDYQAVLTNAADLAKKFNEAVEEKGLKDAAIAKACGVTVQAVAGWHKTGRIHKRHLRTLAEITGRPTSWWLGGESDGSDLKPREEILLLLFRGLFSHQQLEVIQKLRAAFDANQFARKEMGVKELKGVSNEAVRVAFKDVPQPKEQRKPSKKASGRNLGDAMGDFLE